MDIFEPVCILVTLYGLEKIQNNTCSPKVIKCMLHNNWKKNSYKKHYKSPKLMSVRKLSFTVVQPVITSLVVEENRKQKYCRLRPKKIF